YDKHVFGATLFYRFRPLTSALIEYNYGIVDYPHNTESNNTFNSVLAGLTWEPTGIIRGTLKGGFTFKDFDEEDRDAKDTYIIATDLEAHYTDFTAVGITVFRNLVESDFAGTDFYTSTGGELWISHQFTAKISGRGSGGYTKNSYNEVITFAGRRDRRKEDLWHANASLGYQIQDWLSVGLEYMFTTRSSTFEVFDYDRHVGLFYIKAGI
ncbi:MAG: outer membrane beta-barrel protein, partial [Deltaproteobacteria bacterium]|nr:outer membrane beta-barrel protein [Deltaproteobacteria bacterium]